MSLKYGRVWMEAMGYELPPIVVSSEDLEAKLEPAYRRLHLQPGQLEVLTGISERRWWEDGHPLSAGAAAAARKALTACDMQASDVEVLIYAGVCREHFEPATACAVADALGMSGDSQVYDVTNACLGVLNGIIDIANRIELKQIRAGMVVSCESSREIMELTMQRLNAEPTMERFASSLATLTGGSGATAIILSDGSFGARHRHRLLGGATKNAAEHHRLCRWGLRFSPVELSKLVFSPDRLQQTFQDLMQPTAIPAAVREALSSERWPAAVQKVLPSESLPRALEQFMATDSVGVLKHGVELGLRTWGSFLKTVGWARDHVDKVICHQVGHGHRETILKTLGIAPDKDFSTFRHLGNIGTVSLPLTAAMADQRRHLQIGDRVGFLGIGSGLNCLMLGWEW